MQVGPGLKLRSQAGRTLVDVKVVPGASRDRITGVLGDRLKIAVSAPAEKGKANKAVCAALAEALGISPKSIEVLSGPTQPRKTLGIEGLTPGQVRDKLKSI